MRWGSILTQYDYGYCYNNRWPKALLCIVSTITTTGTPPLNLCKHMTSYHAFNHVHKIFTSLSTRRLGSAPLAAVVADYRGLANEVVSMVTRKLCHRTNAGVLHNTTAVNRYARIRAVDNWVREIYNIITHWTLPHWSYTVDHVNQDTWK